MKTMMLRGAAWSPWLGQVVLAGSRRARLGDVADLNDSTFADILTAQAAVVDFWSPTCLPCLKYKPTFLDVAGQVQNVTFATVNADESPDTMAKYKIDSIPATLFFLNGQLVNQTSGPMTKDDLTAAVRNMMIAPAAPPPTPTPPDQVAPQTQGPTTPPAAAPTPAATPAPAAPTAPPTTPRANPQQKPATQAPASATGTAPAQDSGALKTILLVGGIGILAVGAITLLAGRK